LSQLESRRAGHRQAAGQAERGHLADLAQRAAELAKPGFGRADTRPDTFSVGQNVDL
jgi:hypothetical protein